MSKVIASPREALEETSRKSWSGCLIVSEPKDKSVSWKLYVNKGKLQYATSSFGQQERLTCLWQQWQLETAPPQLNTEESEYKELFRWWKAQTTQKLYLSQLILQLSEEALVQILSLEQTSIQLLANLVIKEPIADFAWRELAEKQHESILSWQKLRSEFGSPFSRLYLKKENTFNFYRVWKELNQKSSSASIFHTQKLSVWLNLLQQKKCLYELANQITSEPLTLAQHLQPFISAELLTVLPFKEQRIQPEDRVVVGKASLDNRAVSWVACIDDSKTVQRQVKTIMEAVGYQVIGITEPSAALKELIKRKPVLIFMDINMPNIDGYELCSMLRRSRKLRDVPIVMLTGKDGLVDRVRAKMVGTNGYLTKPFRPHQLIELVEKLAQPAPIA